MRNPGLLRGGFHDKVVSILSFYFLQQVKLVLLLPFFFFFREQDCLHALLRLHRWQCSTPGVCVISFPVNLPVVQMGFSFLSEVIKSRKMLMYKSIFRVVLHNIRSARLFNFEYKVLKYPLVHLEEQRFTQQLQSLSPRPAAKTEVGNKNISNDWKSFIWGLMETGWIMLLLALFLGRGLKWKDLLGLLFAGFFP